jgi:hypothetical protein
MSKYKVWHIPQVPGKAFEFETDSLAEADTVQSVLADYDLFQYENRIKGDYCNASGIVEQDEDGDWCEIDQYDIDASLGRL